MTDPNHPALDQLAAETLRFAVERIAAVLGIPYEQALLESTVTVPVVRALYRLTLDEDFARAEREAMQQLRAERA